MTLSLGASNPISSYMNSLTDRLKEVIRDVPDFPKPGIMFKDITPILQNPQLAAQIVDALSEEARSLNVDAIAGVESRGFFFGPQMARSLSVPFIPIRKKGKLPYHTVSYAYDLEYGQAVVEMHKDAVDPGMRVLVHDDLLATGGTAMAGAELVKMQQGVITGFSFLVELAFLNGRNALEPYQIPIHSVVTY